MVLDNCEHLLGACRELVAALVAGCGGVRVLCTSRERLGVAGEVTVVLPALELPAAGERLPVAGLAEAEALRLEAIGTTRHAIYARADAEGISTEEAAEQLAASRLTAPVTRE